MKSFQVTSTQQIKRLLDCTQETKRRPLYMHSSMVQGMPRSGRLLVLERKKVRSLNLVFLKTLRRLKNLENKLVRSLRSRERYQVLMDVEYRLGLTTQHLTHYSRVRVRLL